MTDSAIDPPLAVRRATLADLDALAPLFDAYRGFYGRPSDRSAARAFLAARLERDESVVLLARAGAEPAGFTQLYPSFSSVSAAPIWILNDLYVAESARRRGVGEALLEAAVGFARGTGAVRLALSTARTNHAAQRLYQRRGWVRDDAFLTFEFALE